MRFFAIMEGERTQFLCHCLEKGVEYRILRLLLPCHGQNEGKDL